jgi:hypothetical protein
LAKWKKYVRNYGVELSVRDYFDLFWRRTQGEKVKIPKGMDDGFSEPQSCAEREIKALIDQWRAGEVARLEQDLFKQRRRLADAERILGTKPTKKATEEARIATAKDTQTQPSKAINRRRVRPSLRHDCHKPTDFAGVVPHAG